MWLLFVVCDRNEESKTLQCNATKRRMIWWRTVHLGGIAVIPQVRRNYGVDQLRENCIQPRQKAT